MSGSDWKLEWSGNWAQQIHQNYARAINYQEFKETHLLPPPSKYIHSLCRDLAYPLN